MINFSNKLKYFTGQLFQQSRKNAAKKSGCLFYSFKTDNPEIDVLCSYGMQKTISEILPVILRIQKWSLKKQPKNIHSGH